MKYFLLRIVASKCPAIPALVKIRNMLDKIRQTIDTLCEDTYTEHRPISGHHAEDKRRPRSYILDFIIVLLLLVGLYSSFAAVGVCKLDLSNGFK
jgi:hypothetical protein